jgi:tetratricopeptide (TPR) repeat protein
VSGIVPLALLAMLELALRLGGCGYPTSYFVASGDGSHVQTNRQFGWRFYPRESAIIPDPARFTAEKPKNVTRVFILGESAAVGTPDPAYGFARILQVMLRDAYPAHNFEVIDAAMRGIDSHVILPIARDCSRLEPDLFILYLGNNEFVRLHAPSSDIAPAVPRLRLLRLRQALRATKLVQFLEDRIASLEAGRGGKPAKWDMDFFRRHRLGPDDPRKAAVYDNFRANLGDILETVRGSGARAIVSTVAVNLRDFPPLGSLHKHDLNVPERKAWAVAYAEGVAAETTRDNQTAIARYEQAERIDACFAELHFRLARCGFACGQLDKARREYVQARDCDALDFRADSRVNEIIRQLTRDREREGIYFVDMERRLLEGHDGDDGIPGETLFRDHVHFTFDGDYVVASRLLPVVAAALNFGKPAGPTLSRQQCADLLAYSPCVEADLAEPTDAFTSRPPFLDQLDHAARQSRAEALLSRLRTDLRPQDWARAVRLHQQAIECCPSDWQLHYNLARLLRRTGDVTGAISQFERTLQLYPKLVPALLGLGYARVEAGRVDSGLKCMEEAQQIDPNSRLVKQAVEYALAKKERS